MQTPISQFDARPTKVLIVGSGLTGLTLAYLLRKKGIPLVVLERDKRAGGVIRSHHEQGFLYEAGPNTGVLGNLEVMELFRELSPACTLEVADEKAKKRLIWKDGRWHCLPSGFIEAVKTPLFRFSDKLRILGEPFRRRGNDPMESLSELVKRRMGQSFLDYAIDPFISGIYAGDPDMLITRYALPKLYRLEQTYGSFIGGAIKKRLQEKGPTPSREVFSVKGGLQNLVHALVDGAGHENIFLGAENIHINPASKGEYRVYATINGKEQHIDVPVVISTIGAHSIDKLLPFLKKESLEAITQLEYARVVQVVLGFKTWEGANIKAFGGLVPSREKRKILGVLFPSSFLSDRAPEGGALLNVFLGGVRHPEYHEMPDDVIRRIVGEEVTSMMRMPQYRPDLEKVFRYRHAIPQYDLNTGKRLEAIESIQQDHPGLILAGNLHEGIGMADRIAQAMRIAASFSAQN